MLRGATHRCGISLFMKSHRYRFLRAGVLLGAVSVNALIVSAVDETLAGNLTVTGSALIGGGVQTTSIIDSDNSEVIYENGNFFGNGSDLSGVVHSWSDLPGVPNTSGDYINVLVFRTQFNENMYLIAGDENGGDVSLQFPFAGQGGRIASQQWVEANFLGAATAFQPYSASLNSLAGLATSANKGIYASGVSIFSTYDLTAAGRAILDDVDIAAQRATLGLVIGTDVLSPSGDGYELSNVVHSWVDLPGASNGGSGMLDTLEFNSAITGAWTMLGSYVEGGLSITTTGPSGPRSAFLSLLHDTDAVYYLPSGGADSWSYTFLVYDNVANKAVIPGDVIIQGMLGNEGGGVTINDKLDVSGDVQVLGKIRIPESGDLSMGGFTAGTNPAP
jgi:hypothetical protein